MTAGEDGKAPVVEALNESAGDAKRCIAKLFDKNHGPNHAPGWGQYIADIQAGPMVRTGIFGTAAGLEVLSETDAPEYHTLILDGLATLPLLNQSEDEGDESLALKAKRHYEAKDDLEVTHKVAAILDAACSLKGAPNCNVPNLPIADVVSHLLALRNPKSGWPDHRGSGGSSVHATAVALLSLSRVEPSDAIKEALRETTPRFPISSFQSLAISTTSILLLALQNFEEKSQYSSELKLWAEIAVAAQEAVVEWIGTSSAQGVKRTLEATEYASPPKATADQAPASGLWSFLLYIPHVLVAHAVLRRPQLRAQGKCRRFVLQVMDIVTSSLEKKDSFVTGGREQVSTVEHLWIFRLLVSFESAKDAIYGKNVLQVLADKAALSRTGERLQIATPVVFAVCLIVAAQFVDSDRLALGLRLAGSALIGTFARQFWRALRRWL